VPEVSTQAAGLRTGTYHLLPNVDPGTAEILNGVSGITMLSTQDLAYSLLGINTTRPPLTDPRVREAINLAIDRSEIVEAVYFGNAVEGGPLSPGLSDWALSTNAYSCYQHDAERARALLAEAGAEGLDIEILTFGTLKVVADLAQVLQAQLQDAGFNAELNIAEFGTFVQRWRNSDFDVFVSLNGGNIDPDGYLYRTFHTGGSTNVFQYSNAQVDAMLDAGRVNVAFNTRQGIYEQIQRLLACDGPIAHVAYGTLFTAHRDNVEGFQQIPTQGLRYLRNVTLR
jgi:peptide/nickel transport system substrate-binding protein